MFEPAEKKAWFKLFQVFWEVVNVWPVSESRRKPLHLQSFADIHRSSQIFTDLLCFVPFLACRKMHPQNRTFARCPCLLAQNVLFFGAADSDEVCEGFVPQI